METVKEVVPWFLNSMPDSYFNQVSESMRRSHLKAVAAIHDLRLSDLSLKIINTGDDGAIDVTILTTNTQPGSLLSQLSLLNQSPMPNHELGSIKIFSSEDGQFALNIFTFEPAKLTHVPATLEDAPHILKAIEETKQGLHSGDPRFVQYDEKLHNPNAMAEYISHCTPSYLKGSQPRRFLLQRGLYEQVKGTDDTAVHIETYRGSGGPPTGTAAWVTLANGNAFPDELLKLTAEILQKRGISIWRAHLDTVYDPENSIELDEKKTLPGYVTLLRLLVSPDPQAAGVGATPDVLFGPEFIPKFTRDLKRSKWLDDRTLNLAFPPASSGKPAMGTSKAEVITCLASMTHSVLSKINPVAYASVQNIVDVITSSNYLSEKTQAIAQLFLDRANPSIPADQRAAHDRSCDERAALLAKDITQIQREEARHALNRMLEVVQGTLKTNFYNDDRYALSLRVDPRVMLLPEDLEGPKQKEVPFGVFFSHGRYFNGFHCRFRDIARGGLRIVTPPNSDTKSFESGRHFDEVYGLSYGQQLKNKDIPEGGAKAVVLVDSPSVKEKHHEFLKRKCVRGFVDSILDLTVRDERFKSTVVDRFGKDEVIFLGPDEKVIPADIDWIVHRAAVRGYGLPAAFMSSKRGAGFNHKEFGVTSEGVVVYLDVALRESLNINPRTQPFTVKITGGPDGDVAGNLIKILFRDFGTNPIIVGISDGEGVAEDPDGLNKDELLRLVHESLTIDHFDKSKLGPEGIVMRAKDSEEAVVRRNSMPFRLKADAFVPAGGRPNTINATNWENFLDENRQPTSKLIVEGANIYITKEARESLFKEAGVIIVKDSSANKCGVVTSSCEIAGSMLLSKDEFIANKPKLIRDVLVHLRNIAEAEANLLFSTYKNFPGALPHFSERISGSINSLKDAIIKELEGRELGDPLLEELLPLVKSVPSAASFSVFALIPPPSPSA
jgi:glutamate dehydrogenase